jgi:RNA-directed DNA polymerase
VDGSPLPVRQTLTKLGIPKSSYYRWQHQGSLEDKKPIPKRVWNRLLDDEVATVLAKALQHPDRSSRELAFLITDEGQFSVSESTVYRLLKRHGLIREAPLVFKAAKEYHRKTTHIHELWQTDFTYFHILNWGWYFVGGVIDDYSRYLIRFDLMKKMDGNAVQELISLAINKTGALHVPVHERVKILSDNGSGYIARPFNDYLKKCGIKHIFTKRCHPQTNGKIERLNRTAKEKLTLVLYSSPHELREALSEFRHWYNHEHYHESIGNLHPIDLYQGRAETIKARRKQLQTKTKMTRLRVNTQSNQNKLKLRNLQTTTTP